ncbi:MAG: ABC transporter permease [Clostridium sp.]|uniref:ABC transporter permease n=1 Tax=Clostridium chrysemydis TaxID=2665504 RepID=UPI003EE6567C
MKRFFTIFSFTFKEAIRNKGFIISTLITLVFLFGFSNLDKIVKVFDSGKADKVLVLEDSKTKKLNEESLKRFNSEDYDFILGNNLKELDSERKKLTEDKSDYVGILVVETEKNIEGKLYVNKEPSSSLQDKVHEITNNFKVSEDIKKFNLKPDEYKKLMTPANVEVIQKGNASSGRMMIVYFLIFMLYGGMIGLGSMVAMSVLEEKSNRIMESLITMAKPLELFFGKVLGICAVGVVQFGVLIGAGSLMLKNSGMASSILESANVDYKVIITFCIFFLIGYLTFSLLYGALGSLASNMQDANGALGGITYIIIAVFIIAMQCLNHVDSTPAIILSYIPFASPLVMFERIILSNVGILEIILSIGLNLLYIFIIGFVSAKIYKRGSLHYGTKLSVFKVIKEIKK